MTASPADTHTYEFDLDIEGQVYTIHASMPEGEISLAEFLPSIWQLQDALIGIWIELAASEGRAISCRAGCGACCRQLAPISAIEALHLKEVVDSLPSEARSRVLGRFRKAVEQLQASGLAEPMKKLASLSREEKTRLGLDYFHAGIPCPFLDDEENCSIHAQRPSSCREYLVTSPAAHCANPNAEDIQMLQHAARFSRILFTFADGKGDAVPAVIPLVLALNIADNPRLQRKYHAPTLFDNFLERLPVLFSQE